MAKAFADGSRPAGPAYHAPLMTSLGSPGGGCVILDGKGIHCSWSQKARQVWGSHAGRVSSRPSSRDPRTTVLATARGAARWGSRSTQCRPSCAAGVSRLRPWNRICIRASVMGPRSGHQSSLINGSHRLPKLEMARSHRGRGPGSQLAALMAGNGREPVGLRVGEAAAHLDGVRRWMAGDGPRTEGTAEGNMDVCGCFDFPPAHDATFHFAGAPGLARTKGPLRSPCRYR